MERQFEPIFCHDCKLNATLHADGSIACGCSFVSDTEGDDMPKGWNTTRENIYRMQTEERDYQQTD